MGSDRLSASSSTSASRTIQIAYLSAIAVVAGFIVAGHFWADHLLVDRKELAAIINTSGRQRMLSQKIAKESFVFDGASAAEGADAVQLQRTLEEWAGAHGYLKELTFGDPELEDRFAAIEQPFRVVRDTVRGLIDRREAASADERARLSEAEGRFLVGMNEIVFRYEAISKAQTEEWRRISRLLTAGALLILLLEGYFIFRPLVKRVTGQFRELERTGEELRRSNRDLEGFSRAASHDLKSPLHAVKLLAQWVLEDAGRALPDESREHLETIVARADRMDGYLDGMLEYSTSGQDRSPVEEIDVEALVHGVIDDLAKPQRFRIEALGEPLVLMGRRPPLRSVLQNLVQNAVKHRTSDEGRARVSWATEGDQLVLRIEDDGAGIEPEYREQIFRMFKTLRPRDEFESSGVGLAIVKRLLEKEGGEVGVDASRALGGALFEVRWPRRPRVE